MRTAKVQRKTKETDITLQINLDGKGQNDINTSIPFLDHMLNLLAFHGMMDLKIKAKGDIEVDYHHLMEDIGITLGDTIKNALGDKKGIKRYGTASIPMDESLATVIMDISGRPFLVYNVKPSRGKLKDLDISLFEDFFRGLSSHAMMTLHVRVEYGRDLHHIIEAVFKAFGRALKMAVTIEKGSKTLPSTKGKL
jgi:imidazoleglycerol-phosphate dehydratase